MEVVATDQNFKEEVLEAKMPVLVDFWADWCMPCRMIAPTVEEIAREYEGKLKVCKLNVDESPSTAARYGIMSIPTLIIFKEGRELERIVGVVPRSVIDEKLKLYI